MSIDLLTNALPLMNGARVGGNNGHPNKKAEYKLRKHKLEKLDSTISDLPPCFDEWLNSLNGYCTTGKKLASLLETVLEDTPLLMTVSQYKEACEQVTEKCKRLEIHLQPEFVSACKKVGPCVSQLRSSISTHAKSLTKYETAQSQYENINSDSASKAKLDQAETKFKNALQDFAKQDRLLAEASDELDKLRVESMGSCFLSLLEAQSSLLSSAIEVMGPLGSYKEIGQKLIDTKTTSVVKEATLGWLAAAQVYRSLRTFGSLSRNDIQCMMFTGSEGLPETIRKGLNSKVDHLLKLYLAELEKTLNTPRILPGGFHNNPKGIELALKDCCSELESVGAGAPHVQERQEKEEQIDRDVPRTVYNIGSKTFGAAYGRDVQANVQDKLSFIEQLVSKLPAAQRDDINSEKLHEFAFYVLNESCTTVTNTSAKTAVQLVYGKANLILVRASPNHEDFLPVEISSKGDSIVISVRSSWWLVEDYATLSNLSRLPAPESYIGVVQSTYTIELSLLNFLKEKPDTEIANLSVECTNISAEYFSTIQYTVSSPELPAKKSRGFRSKKRAGTSSTFQSYVTHNDDDRDPAHGGRLPSSEGECLTDGSSHHSSHGNSPFESVSTRSSDRVYGGSGLVSRGPGGRTNLYKTPSVDSISTITSGVTLKAPQPFEEDLTDLLRSDQNKGLTEDRLKALSRSDNQKSSTKRYSKIRSNKHLTGGDVSSRNEDRREDWEHSGKGSKQNGGYSENSASFNEMYLSSGSSGYNTRYKGKDGFNEDDKEMQQSQISNETDGVYSHSSGGGGGGGGNNLLSADSGIMNMSSDRINGRYHDDRDEGGNVGGIGPYFKNHSLGLFIPNSSDSESESASGGRDSRDSRNMDGGGFSASHEDIPRRSMSSASSHGPHPMVGSSVSGAHHQVESGESLSLPEKIDYGHSLPFNQAPGSHLHHQRHSSFSSTSSDFGELSQQDHFEMQTMNSSFSQEAPMQRKDDQDFHRMSYSGSYEPRGRPTQYPHFGSDPYPNQPPPPNFPHERQSRPLNRGNAGRIVQEDFSPGPPMMRHPQGGPIPGPGPGPNPSYWEGYGHHGHMHGPLPPPPNGPHHHRGGPHPGPPRGPPVPHDIQFHHMAGGFRSTTPDMPSSSSSISSMSPAPSPRPTPPTTPPPPHHPQMMQMGPPPMRMPPQGLPPPQRGGLPPPPIGPGGGHRPPMDYHMQHPSGHPPIQRPPPPGVHHPGGGPGHHNHPPNHMGPPPHLHPHHGPIPMSGHPSEWESGWKRHP